MSPILTPSPKHTDIFALWFQVGVTVSVFAAAFGRPCLFMFFNLSVMFQNDEVLTFERIPEAVSVLLREVKEMKGLILNGQAGKPEEDRWFDIGQLCEYHPDKPAKKTVYDWVTLRKVPYHKDGKRLRFLKSEIDRWLLGGAYHKTEEELYEESLRFVNGKREGRK